MTKCAVAGTSAAERSSAVRRLLDVDRQLNLVSLIIYSKVVNDAYLWDKIFEIHARKFLGNKEYTCGRELQDLLFITH